MKNRHYALALLVAAAASLAWLYGRNWNEPAVHPAPPAEASASQPAESKLETSAWQAQRALPAPSHDPGTPRRQERIPRAVAQHEPASAAPLPPQAPPFPYAYVGKGRYERDRFAVLSRNDRIYIVRAGDVLEGAYRVQVVGEDGVVIEYLPLGTRETVTYSAVPAGNASAPDSTIGSDEATLLVSGPRQVAIGEEFTLMVGVEPGGVGMTQEGNVELSYDTKVLRRSAAMSTGSADSGRTRIDVPGGYTGHAAATAVQFRVVAAAPTTTEIRIVSANVADVEGRNVAVARSDDYRLTVVTAPAK